MKKLSNITKGIILFLWLSVIFINGAVNSGKSTVAKILHKKIAKTVVIEADSFYYFIGNDEDIEKIGIANVVPIILKNAISSIRIFAEEGFNVIVPYPVSQKNYEFFLSRLKDMDIPMSFFTLAPSLELAMQNRGDRELNEWEVGRVKYHYEIGLHNPKFGTTIDNSEQTPEETAGEILNALDGD